MKISYPHIIENCIGEKIVFKDLIKEPDGDRLIGESYVVPGTGPVMHTHWLQDESFTVIKGKVAYQVAGQPVRFAHPGETILFKL